MTFSLLNLSLRKRTNVSNDPGLAETEDARERVAELRVP